MVQKIIGPENDYKELDRWIRENGCKKLFVVCGSSIRHMKEFSAHLDTIRAQGLKMVFFQEFQPNPLYQSVVKGVERYRTENCDGIMAVGGGSAMDVAKCIKLYSSAQGDGMQGEWLLENPLPNKIPFLAVPTTAGTGSEATRYAVIYYKGAKQSVTSESCIPETVLIDSRVLKTLPLYQKKATMMDALCHAIESFWSINSTEQSRRYSESAIRNILENMDGYLGNTEDGNAGMLYAANTAGKAINITQTTAGHAMCYKLTSLFEIAHGHAAILCNRVLLPWMVENIDKCRDPRGKEYLEKILRQIAQAMGCESPMEAANKLNFIFDSLKLEVPTATKEQMELLENSVNVVRLKNHPITLDQESIDFLYHRMLNGGE